MEPARRPPSRACSTSRALASWASWLRCRLTKSVAHVSLLCCNLRLGIATNLSRHSTGGKAAGAVDSLLGHAQHHDRWRKRRERDSTSSPSRRMREKRLPPTSKRALTTTDADDEKDADIDRIWPSARKIHTGVELIR
ncbi:hypothetical protein E2562_002688 [Oryza meyeriana var. granulata]|uniref:Uncharacterized protein n=1 Tax=Oryza meyeriana var. granulata TaxID=110450 RepID=A0A6G1BR76_9ORYZ|nr:hypothetical protein E2562_002688 [Oryza meyeriana var. granulata]